MKTIILALTVLVLLGANFATATSTVIPPTKYSQYPYIDTMRDYALDIILANAVEKKMIPNTDFELSATNSISIQAESKELDNFQFDLVLTNDKGDEFTTVFTVQYRKLTQKTILLSYSYEVVFPTGVSETTTDEADTEDLDNESADEAEDEGVEDAEEDDTEGKDDKEEEDDEGEEDDKEDDVDEDGQDDAEDEDEEDDYEEEDDEDDYEEDDVDEDGQDDAEEEDEEDEEEEEDEYEYEDDGYEEEDEDDDGDEDDDDAEDDDSTYVAVPKDQYNSKTIQSIAFSGMDFIVKEAIRKKKLPLGTYAISRIISADREVLQTSTNYKFEVLFANKDGSREVNAKYVVNYKQSTLTMTIISYDYEILPYKA